MGERAQGLISIQLAPLSYFSSALFLTKGPIRRLIWRSKENAGNVKLVSKLVFGL